MADTVTTKILHNGARNLIVRLNNQSDGTGEGSAVQKVDISTLLGPDGQNPPAFLALHQVQSDIQGFTRVDILADATVDQAYVSLGEGQGYLYRETEQEPNDVNAAGFTGDINLRTFGAIADASYEIELHFKKR